MRDLALRINLSSDQPQSCYFFIIIFYHHISPHAPLLWVSPYTSQKSQSLNLFTFWWDLSEWKAQRWESIKRKYDETPSYEATSPVRRRRGCVSGRREKRKSVSERCKNFRQKQVERGMMVMEGKRVLKKQRTKVGSRLVTPHKLWDYHWFLGFRRSHFNGSVKICVCVLAFSERKTLLLGFFFFFESFGVCDCERSED